MSRIFGSLKASKRNEIIFVLLIMPALLLRIFTSAYPIVVTFVESTFNTNKIFKTNQFIGLGNFIHMFSDSSVKDSITFTLIFTVASVLLHIVLGIALALLLNCNFSGRKLLRSTALIPWALPLIAAGIAASWGFDNSYGFVNDMIRRVIPGFQYNWLVQNTGSRFAVILTDVWKDTPFFAILMLSGIQNVSLEIYEAAKIDGAGAWKRFKSITLPCIAPLLATMTIFFTLWRLISFDLVYAMTQGGPGASTSLLSYRIFVEAFKSMNFGYASAISVMLCLIMVVMALIGFAIKRKVDYEV
jgi:multiple sugar transport system permease protein